jgi:NitT/TauT family transport system permease protein
MPVREPISARARRIAMALSVLVPLLAWQLLATSGLVDPAYFLPTPAQTLSAGWDMAQSGTLAEDTWASLRRVLLGFGLSVLVAVPLGTFMGTFRLGQAALEPAIGLIRYAPASAFIPLFIIWLGLGEPSKVAMLFVGTIFFNTLMIADAVRRVPQELLYVSYTLGARRMEVVRKVVVPNALPGMIDAVRVNAAAAWNFVVVAELVAADSGLGYRIIRSQRFSQIDDIFAILIVIGVLGLTFDLAMRMLRDRVGRWTA